MELLRETYADPTLEQIAESFSVETVTKEFFNRYYRGADWGTGYHDFLRRLSRGDHGGKFANFFNDVLEPLFYDTLATERGDEAWCSRFKARIPFLNGGLFEPLCDYGWKATDLAFPNELFFNAKTTAEGDLGTGILDVFDRYNFTVNEAECHPRFKTTAFSPVM